MSQDRKPSREQDSAALEKVTTAVDSKETADYKAALAEFRNYLKTTTPLNAVRGESGRGRSVKMLVEAYKLYDENYKKWDGCDSARNTLFWRNVIGELQTKTPTCDDKVTNNKGRSI